MIRTDRNEMPERREAWWLTAEATCGFCAQEHASGTAYHCAVCDRPVCVLCAVEITTHRGAVCPECEKEAR